MSSKTMRLDEVEKLSIWVLADNYYDSLRADSKIAQRFRAKPGKSIHAEHGLAYYIETTVKGRTNAFMFDYGLDPEGVLNNIDLLGIDPGKAAAFGLSHGHFDHWSGVYAILKRAQPGLAQGTPFYAGEECFARRYSLHPGSVEPSDLGQLKKEEIEALGLKVVEVAEPMEIIPGAYSTGPIERVTTYESVPPTLLIKRSEKPEPDDFRGEQAIFFSLKGKGLVVLSGCAHAGIVNTIKQARRISGIEKIHAVLGGFHLINAKPEVIQQTVNDIEAMKPELVAPMHCTGFEAVRAFEMQMPDQFHLNTSGTRYVFQI